MSWTLDQVKKGGWKPDARFVEVSAYEGERDERKRAQSRLRESAQVLKRTRAQRDRVLALLREACSAHEACYEDCGCPACLYLAEIDASKKT